METATLEKKIAKLPENLKQKLEGYVDALLDVASSYENTLADSELFYEKSSVRRPVFGSGKGIFGKMADDFDEPLDDMKDYM